MSFDVCSKVPSGIHNLIGLQINKTRQDMALRCIIFELSACKNSMEFPVESGCKASDLIRYKVDTGRAFYVREERVL